MHPLIAIVGRPNVGKSTLFNRLVGGRPALVHDTPGLTRDRRYGDFEYFGRFFRVVDTGGLDPDADKDIVGSGIHRQARLALQEADAVLFVVDARAGVMPVDLDLAAMLRKLGIPIMLIGNKIDSPKRDDLAHDLFSLGLGDVYSVSAEHGRGVDDMVQAMCEIVPAGDAQPEPDPDSDALRVALVGKPNAGKSCLLNRLVGAERVLVHDAPGTTTDPIDTAFTFGGRPYVLVDTAGIRRKSRIYADTEKISVSMALNQIKRADVVVLVIDGAVGPSEQDARLAGMIEDSGRAVVIALNKADLLSGSDETSKLKSKTRDEMHFLTWAPIHLMSALRGDGVEELLGLIDQVAENSVQRVQTSELNKFFADVCETHPPPTYNGRSVTIHYLTQGGVRPPTFLLWANVRKSVAPAYRRYIANQLRARYGFSGVPIRIVVKDKVGRAAKPRKKRRGRRR